MRACVYLSLCMRRGRCDARRSCPLLVNKMHTARDYSIVRKDKRLLMTKTKLCCLSCRCRPILSYNNIQTAHDWSWWHSWNIEEIDDESILSDIASCISIIQLSWLIGVREEIQRSSFSLDRYLCEYNGRDRCLAYWPFEPVAVERGGSLLVWLLFSKRRPTLFFSRHSVTIYLWRLMFWSCQQNLWPSLSIVVLAINACNTLSSALIHTRCNCCSSSCSVLSLLVFALYRHTVHTSTYKLRFRHREDEDERKGQYHFITRTTNANFLLIRIHMVAGKRFAFSSLASSFAHRASSPAICLYILVSICARWYINNSFSSSTSPSSATPVPCLSSFSTQRKSRGENL